MASDTDRIRYLAELYMNAETSLLQEQELRAAFSKTDPLPSDLEELRPLFTAFRNSELPKTLPEEFSARLEAKLEQEDSIAEQPKPAVSRPRTFALMLVRAAAVLLPVTGLWIGYTNTQTSAVATRPEAVRKAITDPEQAYAVLENALLLASGKLQKGTRKAAIEVHRMHTATDILHPNKKN